MSRDIGKLLSGLLPVAELEAFEEHAAQILTAYSVGDSPTETEIRELVAALRAVDADNRELRRRARISVMLLEGRVYTPADQPPCTGVRYRDRHAGFLASGGRVDPVECRTCGGWHLPDRDDGGGG
jgi:hypothetical protein